MASYGMFPPGYDVAALLPQAAAPDGFACAQCGKVFSRANNLKSHMLAHTADKPFRCRICETSFVRAYDLRRHERGHTGDAKSYVCEFCNRAFTWVGGIGRRNAFRS